MNRGAVKCESSGGLARDPSLLAAFGRAEALEPPERIAQILMRQKEGAQDDNYLIRKDQDF
jgi:hypothetical protein